MLPTFVAPTNGTTEFDFAREPVADVIGRGCAWAEVEYEMGCRINSKDFEISQLRDRIQYYKIVIHEMSQRNQEAVGKLKLLHIGWQKIFQFSHS